MVSAIVSVWNEWVDFARRIAAMSLEFAIGVLEMVAKLLIMAALFSCLLP
jgi:hypothetical protein